LKKITAYRPSVKLRQRSWNTSRGHDSSSPLE